MLLHDEPERPAQLRALRLRLGRLREVALALVDIQT
jgi:hypothetical protein